MVGMKFREDTQDEQTIFEVLGMNAYRLPARLEPNWLIIDIGAHIGSFAMACAARGACRLACVEPHPDNIALLEDNILRAKRRFPDLRVNTYQAAVSDKAGKANLSYTHTKRHTAMFNLFDVNQGVEVHTLPLDTFLDLSDHIQILKLDCEGGEWPALLQSEKLRRCEMILAEIHKGIRFPGLDCRVEAVVERLESLGFDVETWTNGDEPLAKLNVMMKATMRG